MKHRHLPDDVGLTRAAIDDILDRGSPADWTDLMRTVAQNPFGAVADDVLRVCCAHAMYGTSKLWPAAIAQLRRPSQHGRLSGSRAQRDQPT
ncbi:MAG: hypothetical protein GIX03_05110 [Candidatus Eremiobacteraeota bacterium]|nr:hypothetical protein [Candidatus Eremiobacteraeota bacterium]MBC5802376.1 hypothetical protein [Candidatus Eremiobacteraeota bacterium]